MWPGIRKDVSVCHARFWVSVFKWNLKSKPYSPVEYPSRWGGLEEPQRRPQDAPQDGSVKSNRSSGGSEGEQGCAHQDAKSCNCARDFMTADNIGENKKYFWKVQGVPKKMKLNYKGSTITSKRNDLDGSAFSLISKIVRLYKILDKISRPEVCLPGFLVRGGKSDFVLAILDILNLSYGKTDKSRFWPGIAL